MSVVRTATPTKVLLGMGVFKIGETAVGLTRGGGQFTVEREYRDITADGDRGRYKDRTVMEKSVPKLKFSALEIIGNIGNLYPGIETTADTPTGSTTVTGTGVFATTDYKTVTWTGETKGGKQCVITLENAINLDNIDFTLAEKDDVVATATFEGTYEETSAADYEPWDIVYVS
jgi:hypothetical protein